MITWYNDFESSNVNRLGYSAETQEAHVEFKDKTGNVTSTWAYGRISFEDFELIHHAPSVGAAVNRHLVRGGIYSSRKVS